MPKTKKTIKKNTKELKKVEEPKEAKTPVEESTDYSKLIEQVKSEYKISDDFMRPKLAEARVRLKLYSNQRRDKEAIGDPLLFTIFQTVLASLYDDRLTVNFEAREEGDEETAENVNALSNFDYDEMEKAKLDYEFDWNAAFFGRSLQILMEFDRERKAPVPEVVDMLTWLRDPSACSVNGDMKGRKAMRFGGREIRLSQSEMDEAEIYFDYKDLEYNKEDLNSLTALGSQARSEAQGTQDSSSEKLKGENGTTLFVEWFTKYNGKKVLVTLDKKLDRVVRFTELEGNRWPIVDRTLYPMSNDWDGVSIPDLIEDKQRAKAVLQNLALAGIKIGLNPIYLYDTNRIKNRGNLNISFNKHIPVDGNPTGAIQQVDKQQVKAEVNWILEVLDAGAQKATASPDIQQGIQSEKDRPLGETELISSKVDTRYSLSAKIFGWSEKDFWRAWYKLYKDNFVEGIDEKVIRLKGALGAKWRKFTRENIISLIDPDIEIESKVISEAKKFNELQKYRLFVKDVFEMDPQNANVRMALRKIGRLSGFDKEEIERVLPPSIDELTSEDENDKLNNNELVQVQVFDDDFIHMEVHNKASDTPSKAGHVKAHRNAMMLKRVNPQFDIARNRPENPEEAIPNGGVTNSPGVINNASKGSVELPTAK